MMWNYIEIARLVSLHVTLHTVFWNFVALVITSGKTTWDYWELQVSRKLKHGPWHYIVQLGYHILIYKLYATL